MTAWRTYGDTRTRTPHTHTHTHTHTTCIHYANCGVTRIRKTIRLTLMVRFLHCFGQALNRSYQAQIRTWCQTIKVIDYCIDHLWVISWKTQLISLEQEVVSCCSKSLQSKAPCDSAVYGSLDEMSPAPCLSPNPPPPPDPLPQPDPLPPTRTPLQRRQGGQGRINNITSWQGTLHCSCLEHCFLFPVSVLKISQWPPPHAHPFSERGFSVM